MADPKMIEQMAEKYVTTDGATLQSIAKEFGIGYSTLQGYFAKDLKEISPNLFERVNKKKVANIERTRHNFDTSKKEQFLRKLKKFFHRG